MTTTVPVGIYVPIPTFFHEEPVDEQPIDVETLTKHVNYLCTAGVHGIVCMGTTGEAVHLTDEERQLVLRTARKAIDESGSKAKLVAGCSKESVRDSIKLTKEAAECGAEFALILPPSYFLAWTPNRSDVIYSFYTKVADKSPIPIIIYNFPGVTQQMDNPQENIVRLAAHPNIVGIKCTDGNVGKAGFVCEHTDPANFSVLSGSADSFLPFLTIGSQGCIPGFGNVAPRSVIRLFQLYQENTSESLAAAKQLQGKLVAADHALFRFNGISGLKSAMQKVLGYGGYPRAPLLPTSEEQQTKIVEALQVVLEIENKL